MLMIKNNNIKLFILSLVFTVSGCDSSNVHNDLKKHIDETRKNRIQVKQKLNQNTPKPPAPQIYSGGNTREPFSSPVKEANKEISSTSLLSYPLSMLQFVGTITKQHTIYA